MAGFATHAIFGEEALRDGDFWLPADVIEKHRGVFGTGCQGPDLFLYNIPMLLSCYEKNLGIRMHSESTSRYFAWLLQTVQEAEDKWSMEIGISYLYGALAHYALDSAIHPYVYARIGYNPLYGASKNATSGLHHRLESAIDAKMIAQKKDILPSQYDAAAVTEMSQKERETLADFLAKAVSRCYRIRLKRENVLASIWFMQKITCGFFAASQRQKELLQKLEFSFLENYGLTNFMITDELVRKKKVMNTQNAVWHNPWKTEIASCDSVWEIYDRAMGKYYQYCEAFREAIPLYMENFFAIMGGKEEREKQQKKIVKAAKSIGNLSYETGLAIKSGGDS